MGQSGFFRPRFLIALFFSASACLIAAKTLPAFFQGNAPVKFSPRTLSFAERVVYQNAIENVYWRHRIWPKERPDPKPSLDAVMSQTQIEKKVSDYLRKSQALEDYWQRPITAGQLQDEMDRMANRTKQPEVLRELFAALGNDPFVIAECLARPVLSEQLVTSSCRYDQRFHGMARPLLAAAASVSYTLPMISDRPDGCIDDTWTATSTGAAIPAADSSTANHYHQRAIVHWTGSEMIVWGGAASFPTLFNTGGKYNPSTDSWTATSITNAPAARHDHTAVWAGNEMIVWGGGGI